ncbi:MAG TPA: hypothetical protein VEY30_03355, partial [Myxococcaceae bacterium]|nr:hypothetical protein [Myxococcaceae bacterium]
MQAGDLPDAQKGAYLELLARSDVDLREQELECAAALLEGEPRPGELLRALRTLDGHLKEGPAPGGPRGLEERVHGQLHRIVELSEALARRLADALREAAVR